MNGKCNRGLNARVRGALYGFVIGDAMGATTEFETAETIRTKYGKVDDIIGGGWLGLAPGATTDDTAMTLAVMKELQSRSATNVPFGKRCLNAFVEWLDSNPIDVGATCRRSIEYYRQNGVQVSEDNEALGNGALMRALPCALYGSYSLNQMQASTTHKNSIQNDILWKYHFLIRWLVLNESVSLSDLEDYDDVDELRDLGWRLAEPTGNVVDTFNNALHWAFFANTAVEAIIGAVNHGGDADTIAAITGSIVGARDGYGCWPQRWIDKLDPQLCKSLDEFANFVVDRWRQPIE